MFADQGHSEVEDDFVVLFIRQFLHLKNISIGEPYFVGQHPVDIVDTGIAKATDKFWIVDACRKASGIRFADEILLQVRSRRFTEKDFIASDLCIAIDIRRVVTWKSVSHSVLNILPVVVHDESALFLIKVLSTA